MLLLLLLKMWVKHYLLTLFLQPYAVRFTHEHNGALLTLCRNRCILNWWLWRMLSRLVCNGVEREGVTQHSLWHSKRMGKLVTLALVVKDDTILGLEELASNKELAVFSAIEITALACHLC
jgi:hypothetical protein